MREGEIESDYLMGMEYSSEVMKNIWNYREVVFEQHCECTKFHWIVH